MRQRSCWVLALATACASALTPGRFAVAQAEPDTQIAKPVTAAPPLLDPYSAAEKASQGDLGHPYMLPSASRARMHECAVEWQAMKMSGAATDKIWRVFATACLKTPSAKTPVTPDTSQER